MSTYDAFSCQNETESRGNIMWSSAVITRSSLPWHCDNSGRKWIRYYDNNRHPISCPHRWAMGCLLWAFFGENWPCYDGANVSGQFVRWLSVMCRICDAVYLEELLSWDLGWQIAEMCAFFNHGEHESQDEYIFVQLCHCFFLRYRAPSRYPRGRLSVGSRRVSGP